jgi:hypothetical protein
MEKRWACKEHGFGTDGPKQWGLHVKEHHAGIDPLKPEVKRPEKKRPEEPKDKAGVDLAVAVLRGERMKLAQDLDRLDSALRILEHKGSGS